jgi:hypothetical protein
MAGPPAFHRAFSRRRKCVVTCVCVLLMMCLCVRATEREGGYRVEWSVCFEQPCELANTITFRSNGAATLTCATICKHKARWYNLTRVKASLFYH